MAVVAWQAVVVALAVALVAVAPWADDDPAPAEADGPGSAPVADVSGLPTRTCRRSTRPRSSPRSLDSPSPRSTRCASQPASAPPSNRWYSGLVFGDQPQPVFAEPLSFGLTDSGFTVGLPAPTVDVEGDHRAARARRDRATPGRPPPRSVPRTRSSVTIDLLDGAGAVIGHVVLAEGSPFVSLTA